MVVNRLFDLINFSHGPVYHYTVLPKSFYLAYSSFVSSIELVVALQHFNQFHSSLLQKLVSVFDLTQHSHLKPVPE